ncbi:MAG: hypothetical protein WDM91_10815 [Rhizomicrobium sp.]
MSVIARMRCHAVKEHSFDGGATIGSKSIYLSPVYSSDPADPNYSFSQATPSGEVYLNVSNPAAFEQFKPNAIYDITFEERVLAAT